MTVDPKSPDGLIKYCDAKAAEQILSTHSLRWSSPEVFGDPFELNAQIKLGFTAKSLLKATVKLASSKIFAPDEPQGDSPLIKAIQRWRGDERFETPEESYEVLGELLEKMVNHRIELIDENISKLQAHIRNIRICCFCLEVDNINAWDKYTDAHRGLAIRFALNNDATTANAAPVTYQVEPAQLTTLKEQLSCILHNRKDGIENRFKDQYLNKGPHQKLDKEWRCIQTSNNPSPAPKDMPANCVDDIEFNTTEVTDVYFGISTPEETKKKITAIVKANYKSAKLHQAVHAKTGYAIEFESL